MERKGKASLPVSSTVRVVPSPGSEKAIDEGCLCPVFDNAHGKGIYLDGREKPLFWINADCPLHATLPWESKRVDNEMA